MKVIKPHWDEYKAMVIPSTASSVQVNETRKAFYAGVLSSLRALMSSDADIVHERLNDIIEELNSFTVSLNDNPPRH